MFERLKLLKSFSKYAQDLNKNLYVVGGAVRDCLLYGNNAPLFDLDLTGNMSLLEVVSFANNNKVDYEIKNKKLQVVSLKSEGVVFEYARLREECYENTTNHNPKEVHFVDSIDKDCKRRDFTVNSIYYDTHSSEILDPTEWGIVDIKNKTVRMINNSLDLDPARIIRLVELASRHELKIDSATFLKAKQNAKRLIKFNEIRKQKELNRLFNKKNMVEDYEKYLSRVRYLLKELNLTELEKG